MGSATGTDLSSPLFHAIPFGDVYEIIEFSGKLPNVDVVAVMQ
jgi:hypothetical protein